MTNNITSVAVFCGSQNGNNPIFATHTAELGRLLALAKLKLIYGGGNTGLMGAVANAALADGGEVIGIIPERLKEWERHHGSLTELVVVPDMHTRKKMMYERSDAAIILPGGFGTMDELFEMLTWNQLKIHDKKIYFLNSAGFYDPLFLHLLHMQKEGFLYDSLEERIHLCPTPAEVLDRLI
ncbi:TIGR00730 family Rossman fold protein [Flavitalea sp. BT771]|uniref:LOG family protein n=1 Tax=Flavitalea sp. BT771 TaxID=3063329 RepID=UPI0026E1976D|nr:TIGR00730 family Rossman fold protein [Flavitalea sp. BT771]MDO6435081.1 TIGR00730 family Rossman fold protein [Flavitalea sp. BT771]MDV6223981.1 TIGR00730 family Rossman fold protein [Flavitalea sp. BT771]